MTSRGRSFLGSLFLALCRSSRTAGLKPKRKIVLEYGWGAEGGGWFRGMEYIDSPHGSPEGGSGLLGVLSPRGTAGDTGGSRKNDLSSW